MKTTGTYILRHWTRSLRAGLSLSGQYLYCRYKVGSGIFGILAYLNATKDLDQSRRRFIP